MKLIVIAMIVAQAVAGFDVAARPWQSFPPAPTCGVSQFRTGSDAIIKHGLTYKWTCSRIPVNTSVNPIVVSKPWFKAHCKATSDTSATCSEFAQEDPSLKLKDAAGPSRWRHKLEDVAVTGAVVLIVTACVAGGGCAFAGG